MSRGIKEIVLGNTKVEEDRLAMWKSLKQAVENCGGSWSVIGDDVLNGRMTVTHLIDVLGQNGVRFTVTPESLLNTKFL